MVKNQQWVKNPFFIRFIIVMLVGSMMGVAYYHAAATVDFKLHTEFAMELKETGVATSSHFFYHLLVIIGSELLPNASLQLISTLPVLIASVMLALLMFELLRMQANSALPLMHVAAIAIALSIISPIYVWLESVPNYYGYIGYINSTIYHNPTQNIVKLFVVPVSLFALRAVAPRPYRDLNQRIFLILVCILMVLLMSWSKPNYLICLLPGLGLFVLYRSVTGGKLDWPLLIMGIGLPAIGMLVVQFLHTYALPDDSGIGFGVFTFLRGFVPQLKLRLPIQLVMSILFPSLVYLLHLPQARKYTYLNMSWLMQVIGLLYLYFVYETGTRMWHGNFGWGSYLTLFVLFFASVVFLIDQYRSQVHHILSLNWRQIDWRLRLLTIVFLLHVVSGIRFYAFFMGS